jgi:hypothetical protein
VGVPEHEHVAIREAGEPSVQARRFVLEEVLVDLPRGTAHQPDPLDAELEAQIERQRTHEVLRALIGVREHPRDRLLAELTVVLGDVRAPAVLELARDRVVVFA